jgi:hypothetical protein
MSEVFYNLWCVERNTWVSAIGGTSQSPHNPLPVSKAVAEMSKSRYDRFWQGGYTFEVRVVKKIIEKIIPGFPLDPTLHVLQAGYIQDRQRKRS